jgi:hypothetical protein
MLLRNKSPFVFQEHSKMEEPTFTDYVTLIFNLFDRFVQGEPSWTSQRFTYMHREMIVFFMLMQQRQISAFKAQRRWLVAHPADRQLLGWDTVPNRTTLSRRYKALYPVLQAFVLFVGQDAELLDEQFESQDLYEDKSLFKARGPVWHQSDRQANRIPEKLRNLDTDASWSKSAYHGWVYGYGLHVTGNGAGFPKLVQVETAAYSESQALQTKEPTILDVLQPHTLSGDNGYTAARRIRQWATQGVVLLTPAIKWVKGRYAQAYHTFIQQPDNALLLRTRRTAIEPVFDLIAKLIGADDNHKQLPIQHLVNVRTCIALATFSLQITMMVNSIWALPLRAISYFQGAFT